MENLTKALYMAAGVLIGILVLTAFVWVFSNGGKFLASFEDEGNIKQVEQFNAELLAYQKENNTIYDVISAINKVKDINEQYSYDSQSSIQVVVTGIYELNIDNSENFIGSEISLTDLIRNYGRLVDPITLDEDEKDERRYERYFTGQITYGDQGKINLITFN